MVRLIRHIPKVLGDSPTFRLLPWAMTVALFGFAGAIAQERSAISQADRGATEAAEFAEGRDGGDPTDVAPVDGDLSEPARLSTSFAQPAAFYATSPRGCPPASGAGMGDGCVLPGTNLFWCNPYPERVMDPCWPDPCLNCNFRPAPLWYASVDVVPLFRDQNDRVFQTLGPGGPAVLETGEFDTEFDAGMRLLLGVTLTERYRLEGSYLGDYEWSDRLAVRNASPNSQGGIGNLFSPFSDFGQPTGLAGVDFNRFASIEMTSSFSSIELNLRRRCCNRPKLWPYQSHTCVANSFLLGLRYLEVDEEFGYVTQSGIPAGVGAVNRAFIDTTNEMIGVQIGMLSQFTTYWENGWIDFEIKGGIYHNEATMRSAYEAADGANAPIGSFVGSDDHDRTSFLGEISLSYTHQFTRNLSVRLGYNAFWLTGVALASENLSNDIEILSLGPAHIDHSGDVVYHGPTLGVILAY